MKLFKKSRRGLSPGQQHAAQKFAERILHAQRQSADYLNGKTSGISAKSWKLLLLGFSAGFGGYCLYLLWQAFS
jgi:hypothetical protein